jgi:hypothetical protein
LSGKGYRRECSGRIIGMDCISGRTVDCFSCAISKIPHPGYGRCSRIKRRWINCKRHRLSDRRISWRKGKIGLGITMGRGRPCKNWGTRNGWHRIRGRRTPRTGTNSPIDIGSHPLPRRPKVRYIPNSSPRTILNTPIHLAVCLFGCRKIIRIKSAARIGQGTATERRAVRKRSIYYSSPFRIDV